MKNRLILLMLLFEFILIDYAGAYQTQNMFVVVIDGARYSETFGNNSANLNHSLIPHIWNDLRPTRCS